MNLLRIRKYTDVNDASTVHYGAVRSMLQRHRKLSTIKWLSCNRPRSYTCQRTQKHNAHTSNALEEIMQNY